MKDYVFKITRKHIIILLLFVLLLRFIDNQTITYICVSFIVIFNSISIYFLTSGLNKIFKVYELKPINPFIVLMIYDFIMNMFAYMMSLVKDTDFIFNNIGYILLITVIYEFKMFFVIPFIVSKLLVSAEKQTKVKIKKHIGELLLFIIFPFFGFWFLMPRINEIYDNNKEKFIN